MQSDHSKGLRLRYEACTLVLVAMTGIPEDSWRQAA